MILENYQLCPCHSWAVALKRTHRLGNIFCVILEFGCQFALKTALPYGPMVQFGGSVVKMFLSHCFCQTQLESLYRLYELICPTYNLLSFELALLMMKLSQLLFCPKSIVELPHNLKRNISLSLISLSLIITCLTILHWRTGAQAC